jgi:hypothetical protein
VVKFHSKDGALSFDATMIDVTNVSPTSRAQGASKRFSTSYLVRGGVTKSPVHKQEQIAPLVLWFRPSQLYKVRTTNTALFPSGWCTVTFYIHQGCSDGPAQDALFWGYVLRAPFCSERDDCGDFNCVCSWKWNKDQNKMPDEQGAQHDTSSDEEDLDVADAKDPADALTWRQSQQYGMKSTLVGRTRRSVFLLCLTNFGHTWSLRCGCMPQVPGQSRR